MTDLRQYTGTQRLQIVWTVVVSVLAVGLQFATGETRTSQTLLFAGAGIAWLVGLVVLGLRERRHWNEMVDRSSFDRHEGTSSVDLEKLIGGRSVAISTTVPGLLSQTHTEIRTSIEGVDAEFTVRITYDGSDASDRGITTGTNALDEQFVFEGAEGNVDRILSTEVKAALMDIETPGICTVTGDRVEYVVPFTRLSGKEIETIADTLVVLAERVEAIGR